MIDLHCHLLPGIDDGPSTLKEALELASQMAKGGVTHAVVTPHIHFGRWNNTPEIIQKALASLQSGIRDQNIPLTLSYSAEVRIDVDILSAISKGNIPFLGEFNGKNVLLLELPHENIPLGTEQIIQWLLKQNIIPMIAHPERNKDVIRRYEKLAPLVELGCLFQVTAGSLVGQFGRAAQEIAERMLLAGLVTILASDAHDTKRRPPNLFEGYDAAAVLVGEEEAITLVKETPLKIAASKFTVI
ncbi:tyrosine-protein phosphatase [Litoribrevibacter albus]|uniref:protein-tyrosine-phosphatase n=1 Tax=Litoribrevibacter albus TaxID=1473156 RepID=A0AA37S8L2_9GAMM|nr:CpsB/CapC family capsule biosynthesis tyrosine phosphatase [Litoribrevibacter albus]GLQ30290.1 tyrosine protein phosphatase [Litoribrevibacter albus]